VRELSEGQHGVGLGGQEDARWESRGRMESGRMERSSRGPNIPYKYNGNRRVDLDVG
jgi:hypothetical protein